MRGLLSVFSTIGILFKFQSWPGATIQLGIGLLGLIIVTIIFLIKMRQNTDNYYSNILKRVFIFGAINIFLFAIPTKTLLNWQYPNNPEYIKAVLDAQAAPNNKELWDIVDEEREKMNND